MQLGIVTVTVIGLPNSTVIRTTTQWNYIDIVRRLGSSVEALTL
jgi:hypothetical protein